MARSPTVAASYVEALEPRTHLAATPAPPKLKIDPTFGDKGHLNFAIFAAVHDEYEAVTVLADGKLLVASQSADYFVLSRYSADGVLDADFAAAGRFMMKADVYGGTFERHDDGGLVYNLFDKLLHLTEAGLPDESFGPRGFTRVPRRPGGNADYTAVDAAGGTITLTVFTANGMVLRRFDPAGERDMTFGGADGEVVVTPDWVGANFPVLAVDPKGRILVGRHDDFNYDQWVLTRYTPAGALDETFGDGGEARSAFPAGGFNGEPAQFLFEPSGTFLVMGEHEDPEDFNVTSAMVRFTEDGRVDASFNGGAGLVPFQNYEPRMSLDPNGRLFVANPGYEEEGLSYLAFNPDGTVDTSYGVDGLLVIKLPGDPYGVSPTFAPDGGIVVAAPFASASRPTTDILITRYDANGKLVKSFGRRGRVVDDGIAVETEVIYTKSLVLPDGRFVVAGKADRGGGEPGGGEVIVVRRYLKNGRLDESFGEQGTTLLDFGRGEYVGGLGLQKDGRIVVAGEHGGDSDNDEHLVLARLNPDGSQDRTFGRGDGLWVERASDVLDFQMQPDGKVLIFTNREIYYDYPRYTLLRYTADGRPDTTFGVYRNGRAYFKPFDSFPGDSAIHVAPSGAVTVAVAGTTYADDTTIEFLHLDRRGRPRTQFGRKGIRAVTLAAPPGDDYFVRQMDFAPDGGLLLAIEPLNDRSFVARYDPRTLRPDPRFGDGGFLAVRGEVDQLDEAGGVVTWMTGDTLTVARPRDNGAIASTIDWGFADAFDDEYPDAVLPHRGRDLLVLAHSEMVRIKAT